MEFIDLVLKVREILFDFSLRARQASSDPDLPELTLRQFYYLDVINKMKLTTSSELSEKLNLSKPAVTAIVTKLYDLGYLNKIQCTEDRRFFYISLSEKGARLIESNNKTAREWANHIESVLSPDEQKKYSEMLEKVVVSYSNITAHSTPVSRFTNVNRITIWGIISVGLQQTAFVGMSLCDMIC